MRPGPSRWTHLQASPVALPALSGPATQARSRKLKVSCTTFGRLFCTSQALRVSDLSHSPREKDQRIKSTIQLPQTPFSLRANAAKREHLFRRRTTEKLYRWQKEQSERPTWFQQDGPPYANGSIHSGHVLNKILKDITNRYQLLRGKRVFHTPGWDTHGLPIEAKIQGMIKGDAKTAAPSVVRPAARKYAAGQIEAQKESFLALGLLADMEKDTYQTFDISYEAHQLNIFAEMVRKGLIYRAKKPVHWSPASGTALAEAELYYEEEHVSRSVTVTFNIKPGPLLMKQIGAQAEEISETVAQGGLRAVVWTTTPFTLPGNMALAIHKDLEYAIARPRMGPMEGQLLLIGSDRVQWLANRKCGLHNSEDDQRKVVGDLEIQAVFKGASLLDSQYHHFARAQESAPQPIFHADFVSSESGSAIVHMAPAHGADDYDVCYRNGLISSPGSAVKGGQRPLLSLVDERGHYAPELVEECPDMAALVDVRVAPEAHDVLVQWLADRGVLVNETPLKHKYPYDWRSKTPTFMRATPQWFVDLTDLKERALEAMKKVKFIPESSRSRLEAMVRSRGEWCISRQRAWGVPLPVLYDATSGEPLLTEENVRHIVKVFEEKGTDYWWEGPAEDFVASPYLRSADTKWIKGTDTLDVWFDSGASWLASNASPAGKEQGNEIVADLYLEGTDQHRGWFQSSLLTKVAYDPVSKAPEAPYKAIATHGWVLNDLGEKMSKSSGNYIDPMWIVKGGPQGWKEAWGADTLRMWVAKMRPWESDSRISKVTTEHANNELRKWRTTIRFLLSTLPPAGKSRLLNEPDVQEHLTLVDRWVLHRLRELEVSCIAAYEELSFATVFRAVSEFCTQTLSKQYFVCTKDRLYLQDIQDMDRIAVTTVNERILETLTSAIAPIVPHLAEEIWHFRNGAQKDPPETHSDGSDAEPSFFEEGWRTTGGQWHNAEAAQEMERLWTIRAEFQTLIDEVRQAQWCKSGSDIVLRIELPDQGTNATAKLFRSAVLSNQKGLEEILGAAYVEVHDRDQVTNPSHSTEVVKPSGYTQASLKQTDAETQTDRVIIDGEVRWKNWLISVDLGNACTVKIDSSSSASQAVQGSAARGEVSRPAGKDIASKQESVGEAEREEEAQNLLRYRATLRQSGIRLTVSLSPKQKCPRCRHLRAPVATKPCEGCAATMKDMGVVIA